MSREFTNADLPDMVGVTIAELKRRLRELDRHHDARAAVARMEFIDDDLSAGTCIVLNPITAPPQPDPHELERGQRRARGSKQRRIARRRRKQPDRWPNE
jgi:hypothetical protein